MLEEEKEMKEEMKEKENELEKREKEGVMGSWLEE